MSPYLILILDVETTGLDPETEHLLEVGALFADGSDFESLILPDRFTAGYQIAPFLEALNPYVFQMHQKSGLLDALAGLGFDQPRPSQVDLRLYRWIRENIKPNDEGKLPEIRLGGFSVDFDLRWVRKHLPMTATLLSRRVVDFSQIADFCVAGGLPDAKYPNGREGAPEAAHRGLADARASLDTYQRALAFLSPPALPTAQSKMVVGIDFARMHDDQVDATDVAVLFGEAERAFGRTHREGQAISAAEAFSASNPSHYRRSKIEPISVIESWGLSFNLGNAIKYIARAGSKLGQSTEQDLQKAIDYLHRQAFGRWPWEPNPQPALDFEEPPAPQNGDSSQASLPEPDPILEELPGPAVPRCGDVVFSPIPNDAPRAVGIMGEDTAIQGLVDVWIDSKTRVAVSRAELILAWDAPTDLLEAFAGRHPAADRAPLLSTRARAILDEKRSKTGA